MLVPQELLSCVVFLGQTRATGERLGGTGFFTSVASATDPHRRHVYLVTAGHCVEGRTDLVARLNKTKDPGGGTKSVDLPDGDNWLRHPQPGASEDHVDLATIRWTDADGPFDAGYRWVPQSMYLDEALFSDDVMSGVGLADEVAAIGLLTVHYGTDRNAPVVRTGNLSLIPDEPVVVTRGSRGKSRERLYLTELRSIGGLSGSPVFVRHRSGIGESTVPVSLLGTMIGHWDDPNKNHMGFGMVVPARLLAEVLSQDAAVKEREQAERDTPPDTGIAVDD
jgi:hypothetical protein